METFVARRKCPACGGKITVWYPAREVSFDYQCERHCLYSDFWFRWIDREIEKEVAERKRRHETGDEQSEGSL